MSVGKVSLSPASSSSPLLPPPDEQKKRIKNVLGYEKIQFRSMIGEENSLDSFGESTFSSEDLDVVETEENVQYVMEITIGKLSRIGFKRPLWSSKLNSYFVIISFLMNYEAFITFPALFRQYGEAFPIAYLILMTFVGLPIIYMELALGQYTSTNVITVFSRIAPAFSGLGMAMIVCDMLNSLHDQLILQYISYYFVSAVNALADQMPWHNCVTNGNTPGCVQYRQKCGQKAFAGLIPESERKEDMMENHEPKLSAFGDACIQVDLPLLEMKDIGSVSWLSKLSIKQEIFSDLNTETLLLANWPSGIVLSFLMIAMGCVAVISQLSHRTIVTISQLAVTILISFMCICTLILFLKPLPFAHNSALDGNATMSVEVCGLALLHMIRTLKLGQGRLIFIGAQNSFRNNVASDSLVIYIFMTVIPFIYGVFYVITMDTDLMRMAGGNMETWTSIAQQIYGSKLLLGYAEHVFLLLFTNSLQLYESYEPFILCVFSLMILLMTVAGKVVQMEYLTTAILERFEMFAGERRQISYLLCLVGTVLMLPLLSEHAVILVMDCQKVVFPLLSVGMVLMELGVVAYVYGGRRLIANISAMTQREYKDEGLIGLIVDTITVFLWSFICPFIIGSVMLILCIQHHTAGVSWWFSLVMLAIAPGVLIYRVLRAREARGNIWNLFKPVEELWGPRNANDKEMPMTGETNSIDILRNRSISINNCIDNQSTQITSTCSCVMNVMIIL